MADNVLNPVVGIDLGTTFSCIAHWAGERAEVYKLHDGNDTLPSIVWIQESGKPLVGRHARKHLVTDPENTVDKAKRYMGDDEKRIRLRGKDYTPVEISAMILRQLKEDVESRVPSTAGFDIAGAIITHPQYFKYPQIARTQEAAVAAGLPVIRLLSEPVAAALDYGFACYQNMKEERSEQLMVFDLGGGTFDVTVMQVINTADSLTFHVKSVGGDDMLGGTNFDDDLAQWALQKDGIVFDGVDERMRKSAMGRLLESVIETKIQLSSTEDAYLAVMNILPDQHMEIRVTRADFESVISKHCERIRRIVAATLSRAGLRQGQLDRTILVGGSSRIPVMKEIVKEETGAEPWANADQDLAVCRGAAFLAAMEDGRVPYKKEIIVEEVTAHALGVRAAGDRFAVLIPANRQAPVEASKIFTVNATSFNVVPYQGNGRLITDPSVIRLKEIPISDVKLGADGKAEVRITFRVNEQQILFVKVEAPGVFEQRQMEF